MITAVRLANFKAFAEAQRAPIRPLTLIFGANSSGKSSLIHSLLLARHAMDKGELDVHRTEIGGDAVDLGGFRQYVYRRDVSRRVGWAVEIDVSSLSQQLSGTIALPSHKVGSTKMQIYQMKERLAELLAPVERVSVAVNIGVQLNDKGQQIQGTVPSIISYEIEADGTGIIRMSLRPNGSLKLDHLDHEHPLFRDVLRAIVETSTTAESIHPSDFEGLSETIASIVPEISARIEKFLPGRLNDIKVLSSTSGELSLFPISRGRRKEDLAAAVRFYLPRVLDELIAGLSKAVSDELCRIHYLGPLRSYPPRHLTFSQHHDNNWYAGGGYAWDVVRRDERIREIVNTWLCGPERLQTHYELVIRELIGIDQLEEPLLDGIEGIEVDIIEEGHPGGEYRGREFDPEPPLWGIKDAEAEVARFRDKIQLSNIDKISELMLVDRRSNTIVSHRDIGIGISQVLPVLVYSYAYANKIIAIEQPEIHLHPAIQADLADVFIESALGEQHNTFIIETHSEHLILRILRRIRETTEHELKEGMSPIMPKDVQVIYAKPTSNGTVLYDLPITDDGEFAEKWPDGFFPERANELF